MDARSGDAASGEVESGAVRAAVVRIGSLPWWAVVRRREMRETRAV
jgi:hypothetical protein